MILGKQHRAAYRGSSERLCLLYYKEMAEIEIFIIQLACSKVNRPQTAHRLVWLQLIAIRIFIIFESLKLNMS